MTICLLRMSYTFQKLKVDGGKHRELRESTILLRTIKLYLLRVKMNILKKRKIIKSKKR